VEVLNGRAFCSFLTKLNTMDLDLAALLERAGRGISNRRANSTTGITS